MVGALLAVVLLVQAAWRDGLQANGWYEVGGNDDTVLFVRFDQANTIWARFESREGNGILSSAHLYEVDCRARTMTVIQATGYERRNMLGPSTDLGREYQARRPIPGSLGETIFTLACPAV